MEQKSRRLLAAMFSLTILSVTACLAALSLLEFVPALSLAQEKDLVGDILRAGSTTLIALASFGLGVGIGWERAGPGEGADLHPVRPGAATKPAGALPGGEQEPARGADFALFGLPPALVRMQIRS